MARMERQTSAELARVEVKVKHTVPEEKQEKKEEDKCGKKRH